jgi:membrane-associated protein
MHIATMAVLALGPEWLNPETMLTNLGDWAFWAVLAIIFAECGLLIGFFMPGDSLLFIAGLFLATGAITVNLYLALFLLFLAAFLGNVTGYWIGYKAGPPLFNRPDSRLFKQQYVDRTNQFFNQYGGRAIIMARFVPIVRTFITAIAGVGRMDLKKYLLFSAIGAFLWAVGVTLLGYFLGNIEFVKKNIDLILILIIVVSLTPVMFEYIRHKRAKAA